MAEVEIPVRIAIVIPIYKHAGLAWETVSTALDQGGEARHGIVIVNDGCPFASTERLGLAAASAASRVPLRYVRQSNRGLSAARNSGIAVALETWPDLEAVFFLDADNRLTTRSIRNMTEALDRYPEADWFYPDIQAFGIEDHWAFDGAYSTDLHGERNICEAGSLVRRRVFDAGVRFDETMTRGYEDWAFWLSAREAGFATARHLPGIEYRYRRRPESMLSMAHRDDQAIRAMMVDRFPWLENPGAAPVTDGPADAWFALVTETGVRALRGATQAGGAVAFETLQRDFWRWVLRPEAHGFPGRVVLASDGVIAALQRTGLLDWCFWDLETRLDQAPVASIRLKISASDVFAIESARCEVRQPAGATAVTMIGATDLADLARAGQGRSRMDHPAPSVLGDLVGWPVEGGTASGRHSVRVLCLPDTDQSDGPVPDAFLQAKRTAFDLVHAAYRQADPEVWRWLAPGIGDRIGRPRSFRDHGPTVPRLTVFRDKGPSIAFVMPYADFGGVERVAYRLAATLRDAGYEPHLVCLGDRAIRTPRDQRSGFAGFHWFPDTKLMQWSTKPYQGTRLAEPLNDIDAQRLLGLLGGMDVVINCHGSDLHTVVGSLKHRGTLCLDHQHIVERTVMGQPTGHPFQGLAHEHAYAATICCSETLAQWFRGHGMPEEKLIVVRNGPGLTLSTDDLVRCEQALSHALTRPPERRPLRALYLGRLDRQKGLDRLVALIELTGHRGDIAWRVIGKRLVDGVESEGLSRLDILVEAPLYESRDIAEVLHWADILVLPSDYEGLPLVVVDAMSLGIPVLATDVGALREVVDPGRTGYLFPPERFIADGTATLTRLATTPREVTRLGLEAVRRARDLQWHDSARPLVDFLDRHFSGTGRAPVSSDASPTVEPRVSEPAAARLKPAA